MSETAPSGGALWGPLSSATARVVSLGAGVQSTAMVLMAAAGEIGPMPDAAIFADTGAEPGPVYEHLRWLKSANVALPFPIYEARGGNLYADLMAGCNSTGQRWASIPFFLAQPSGSAALRRGMGRRQCTKEYKLQPLLRAIRELVLAPRGALGKGNRVKRGVTVETWVGITTDEMQRMKGPRVSWERPRWPLVEAGLSRMDCLAWLKRRGYPEPPKSACTFCPYRSDAEWTWLRDRDPSAFAQAIEVDQALRAAKDQRQYRGTPYLHSSLRPLAEVDLKTAAERGQGGFSFLDECEGLCGV